MPSFYKKDLGSAGHRRHLGHSVESTASSEDGLLSFLSDLFQKRVVDCIFIVLLFLL